MDKQEERGFLMHISERIKRARELAGLNLSELSRRLDVDRSTVSKWESGKQEPRGYEVCSDIAKICGVSLVEFWGWE